MEELTIRKRKLNKKHVAVAIMRTNCLYFANYYYN